MAKTTILIFLSFMLFCFFCGCTSTVMINSDPPGAAVFRGPGMPCNLEKEECVPPLDSPYMRKFAHMPYGYVPAFTKERYMKGISDLKLPKRDPLGLVVNHEKRFDRNYGAIGIAPLRCAAVYPNYRGITQEYIKVVWSDGVESEVKTLYTWGGGGIGGGGWKNAHQVINFTKPQNDKMIAAMNPIVSHVEYPEIESAQKISEVREDKLKIKPEVLGQQWAVVVGLSEYANSGQNDLSNLVYADDDAKAFASSLKQQGWSSSHIRLITNEQATQRSIMIAMESWLTKAGPDDMVVLFWSGHGFPDPADPEKVYFACYDTDIRIPATGYRMDRIRTILEERNARNVIVMADTCHAGKLITRGDEKAIGITPYVNSLVKKKDVPKGWIFMVASDVDRKAIEDSSWSHGAFTHCLLKALNGAADGYQSAGVKDGVVTMGELRAFMNSAMPDETQRILGVAKRPIITTSTGDPETRRLAARSWSSSSTSPLAVSQTAPPVAATSAAASLSPPMGITGTAGTSAQSSA